MNGAESLVRTLVANGVNVCFTNTGTSGMHFVAALDKVESRASRVQCRTGRGLPRMPQASLQIARRHPR